MKKFLKQPCDKWQKLSTHLKISIKALLFVLIPLLVMPSVNIFYAHTPLKNDPAPSLKQIMNNQTNGIVEIIVTGPIKIPGVYRIHTNTSLNKLLYFTGGTVDKHLYLPKKYHNYSAKIWLNNNRINFHAWLKRFRTQGKFDYEKKNRREKNEEVLSKKFKNHSRRTIRYQ